MRQLPVWRWPTYCAVWSSAEARPAERVWRRGRRYGDPASTTTIRAVLCRISDGLLHLVALQTTCADISPHRTAFQKNSHLLDVHIPAARCGAHRVAAPVAERGGLTADSTDPRHGLFTSLHGQASLLRVQVCMRLGFLARETGTVVYNSAHPAGLTQCAT